MTSSPSPFMTTISGNLGRRFLQNSVVMYSNVARCKKIRPQFSFSHSYDLLLVRVCTFVCAEKIRRGYGVSEYLIK